MLRGANVSPSHDAVSGGEHVRGVFERSAGGGRGGVQHRLLSAETLLRRDDVPSQGRQRITLRRRRDDARVRPTRAGRARRAAGHHRRRSRGRTARHRITRARRRPRVFGRQRHPSRRRHRRRVRLRGRRGHRHRDPRGLAVGRGVRPGDGQRAVTARADEPGPGRCRGRPGGWTGVAVRGVGLVRRVVAVPRGVVLARRRRRERVDARRDPRVWSREDARRDHHARVHAPPIAAGYPFFTLRYALRDASGLYSARATNVRIVVRHRLDDALSRFLRLPSWAYRPIDVVPTHVEDTADWWANGAAGVSRESFPSRFAPPTGRRRNDATRWARSGTPSAATTSDNSASATRAIDRYPPSRTTRRRWRSSLSRSPRGNRPCWRFRPRRGWRGRRTRGATARTGGWVWRIRIRERRPRECPRSPTSPSREWRRTRATRRRCRRRASCTRGVATETVSWVDRDAEGNFADRRRRRMRRRRRRTIPENLTASSRVVWIDATSSTSPWARRTPSRSRPRGAVVVGIQRQRTARSFGVRGAIAPSRGDGEGIRFRGPDVARRLRRFRQE